VFYEGVRSGGFTGLFWQENGNPRRNFYDEGSFLREIACFLKPVELDGITSAMEKFYSGTV